MVALDGDRKDGFQKMVVWTLDCTKDVLQLCTDFNSTNAYYQPLRRAG